MSAVERSLYIRPARLRAGRIRRARLRAARRVWGFCGRLRPHFRSEHSSAGRGWTP